MFFSFSFAAFLLYILFSVISHYGNTLHVLFHYAVQKFVFPDDRASFPPPLQSSFVGHLQVMLPMSINLMLLVNNWPIAWFRSMTSHSIMMVNRDIYVVLLSHMHKVIYQFGLNWTSNNCWKYCSHHCSLMWMYWNRAPLHSPSKLLPFREREEDRRYSHRPPIL